MCWSENMVVDAFLGGFPQCADISRADTKPEPFANEMDNPSMKSEICCELMLLVQI
jgi:hypothetical protein